jgi:acetate CoA/acetoacetate CoA-transferase alpha subunit
MRTISVEAAVEQIPDHASLLIGGFMGVGTPDRVISEIVRQKKRDLTVIANAPRPLASALASSSARSWCTG